MDITLNYNFNSSKARNFVLDSIRTDCSHKIYSRHLTPGVRFILPNFDTDVTIILGSQQFFFFR